MKIYNFIKQIFYIELITQLFNRKEKTMSIEKQAEGLLEDVSKLIRAITGLVNSTTARVTSVIDTADSAVSGGEQVTKKELAELKKTAKTKAGKVLKDLGKEKLEELLSRSGASKFSELLNEADAFTSFIENADKMLSDNTPGSEDDDLLGEGSEEKEYTLEDVKALLLKVNNAPTLGRDVTRQILADLGVARLPELKKDKFAKAVEKIEATLKDAGVE